MLFENIDQFNEFFLRKIAFKIKVFFNLDNNLIRVKNIKDLNFISYNLSFPIEIYNHSKPDSKDSIWSFDNCLEKETNKITDNVISIFEIKNQEILNDFFLNKLRKKIILFYNSEKLLDNNKKFICKNVSDIMKFGEIINYPVKIINLFDDKGISSYKVIDFINEKKKWDKKNKQIIFNIKFHNKNVSKLLSDITGNNCFSLYDKNKLFYLELEMGEGNTHTFWGKTNFCIDFVNRILNKNFTIIHKNDYKLMFFSEYSFTGNVPNNFNTSDYKDYILYFDLKEFYEK